MRHVKVRYNLFTMQVYVEYALIENFCMDFCLLAAAKALSKNPAKYLRLAAASVLGACFAVVYPLFNLNGAAGITVKLAAGFGLCALAGKYSSVKGYLKFTALFTAATFLTGGALIALFSLAGVSYREGGGYLLSSVPVGIPLFAALLVVIIAVKIKRKFSSNKNVSAYCKIYLGGKSATCSAFYDSGNNVYLSGAPVSIIPSYIAEKLTDKRGIKTFAEIHTVAGKSKIPVFTAEKIEIDDGKSKITRQNVAIGISPRHIYKMVLHPDLSEVN
ncbi:MAG: sigma-E processing peptidase SpoIIGA [Roseburia sp.]|nr:sigma-E processing peptidase SpoIIGA [Roseburia sp.]